MTTQAKKPSTDIRADAEMTAEEKKAKEIGDAIQAAEDRKRADAAEEGSKLDKMLSCLDSVMTRMDAIEDMEKKRCDSAKKDAEDGVDPKKVVADSWAAREDDCRRDENARADAQARADAVANLWGERAPPPMSGEHVRAYRQRLLRRFQGLSADYAQIDLQKIDDPKLFELAETKIYADAAIASKAPVTGQTELRCITRTTPSGHTVREYHGSPSIWMNEFSGPVRQYVSKFKNVA